METPHPPHFVNNNMACSRDDHPVKDQYECTVDDGELHDDFSYDCDDEPDAPPTGLDRRSVAVDRDGVLAAIGYRPDSLWRAAAGPGAEEACERCGRKVYPVERVDIGVIYHRGCFRWVYILFARSVFVFKAWTGCMLGVVVNLVTSDVTSVVTR